MSLLSPCLSFLSAAVFSAAAYAAPADPLRATFASPPDSARPWVYWYIMDGNVTKEGIRADLEAWKKSGIGGGIYLEVGLGIPRGPVEFMSPQWQDNFKFAITESQRLGLQIGLGTGPGWAGDGGPWVTPDLSMQHIVATETEVSGPASFDAVLEQPKPRVPYFGMGALSQEARDAWANYYQDEAVLAFPTPAEGARIEESDFKALYYRPPYSSAKGVAPRLPAPASFPKAPLGTTIPAGKIINLTKELGADGRLKWQVPAGKWTIMRFGRTTTGASTSPAPLPGRGLESDKFSKKAIQTHLDNYTGVLMKALGPNFRKGDSGFTFLHFDSWEMGSQNWTQEFKAEFTKRRGYDPTPFLPTVTGLIVDSHERSERFLWDVRQTANELITQNHVKYLRDYSRKHGLKLSIEPYDLNPASDLDLAGASDLPMGEFWSRDFGFDTEFSCFEAVSAGHTNGLNVIGTESFTSLPQEAWQQHPGVMKNQLDWALCTGINKILFHTYQHQPNPGQRPGMTMGDFGVRWGAPQTWWDMVPAFHKYITRSSAMLRQGAPVSDILYLTPEGAPQVFTPPPSAVTKIPRDDRPYNYFFVNKDGSTGVQNAPASDKIGILRDHKGYAFDGCSPKTLAEKAKVVDGRIVFPGGAAYNILVLPEWDTMTPELLRKITQLVKDGATIIGRPPTKSPSLSGYPRSDAEVAALAKALWGPSRARVRKVGKGRVFYGKLHRFPQLETAKWIWAPGGNPAVSAPVETIYVSKAITPSPSKKLASATVRISADNEYQLSVNGKAVGSGTDFHEVAQYDVLAALKPGRNGIQVKVSNTSNAANPAGLVADIVLRYSDGSAEVVATDATWDVAREPGGATQKAQVLGAYGMEPWGKTSAVEPVYVPYEATAAALKEVGVAPDFSSGQPMRFIHRRLQKGDLYFVGNTAPGPIATTATFRVAGMQPEWWDSVTGESRLLTDFKVAGGLTSIPLRLDGYASGFVVFRQPLVAGRKSVVRPNFAPYSTAKTMAQPWNVAFDTNWGGPASVTFAKLEDWSQSSDPGIKYYSGKAVYTTTFDAPAGALDTQAAIGLGRVENLASVKLNGRDLGTVWCAPWQASIPAGVLKPTGNTLEVTVANLWINRLIGDASLPEDQRKTQTTSRPYGPQSPLKPSGLLGPVTVGVRGR